MTLLALCIYERMRKIVTINAYDIKFNVKHKSGIVYLTIMIIQLYDVFNEHYLFMRTF